MKKAIYIENLLHHLHGDVMPVNNRSLSVATNKTIKKLFTSLIVLVY